MKVRQHCVSAVAVVVAAVLGISCGDGSRSPVIPPEPRATATPTDPPPIGGGLSCPLGDGSLDAVCERGVGSALLEDVRTAIDLLVEQRPELFDKNDTNGIGTTQFKILDEQAFREGVVRNLRAAGLCADYERDLGVLLQVKKDNDISEDFSIVLSTGHIRRGMSSYRNTCKPASFPVDPGPDAPPPGSGCGKPYPPPISRFTAKVHVKFPDFWVLDSTPIVGPDPGYCAAIGFTDGRSLCPLRGHDDPQRYPCEKWRVGIAEDTGLPGPTWKRDGNFCTGTDCAHDPDPDHPFNLLVYPGAWGEYTVCASNGACGKVLVQG